MDQARAAECVEALRSVNNPLAIPELLQALHAYLHAKSLAEAEHHRAWIKDLLYGSVGYDPA